MSAFNKCKDVANSYYKSTIQPKLKERERSYLASEEYYRKLFPTLSETSNFCSRDIKTTVKWMIPSLCEPFLGGDDPVDIKGVNANDDDKATKIQQLLKYQLQRKTVIRPLLMLFGLMPLSLIMQLLKYIGIAKKIVSVTRL